MLQQRTAGLGLGLALLSAATFSTSGSFARSLTEAGWSPAAAVAVRVSLAAVMLAVPAVVAMRGRWRALRHSIATVTVYGLVAVAGCQVFFFNAIQSLSVGVALLIEYLGTVLVVGWLWLRHGNKPRRLTAAGSVVALLGLVLVLDLVAGAHLDPVGVLWALAAAAGLATYFVLSSEPGNGMPPVMMASAGMGIGAVVLLGLGGLGLVPMRAAFGPVDVGGHRTTWLVPVIGLSLVAAAIPYVAGITASRMLGPKLASFVGLTEVVFGVVVAWLLLGELPTGVQLAGGVLIVAGVALVRVDEMRPAALPQRPAVQQAPEAGAVGSRQAATVPAQAACCGAP
ncbi:MAG TPA: EamA family transporter [Pseudonocardiaceae bacterium]|nr:EamA family transporter [Pseudonocardiaceae bacterium]